MPNINDLRFVKTEKLIKDTYLSLKQKSRATVRVNELCETAMINKTTFYAHYSTMDTLHECICREAIEKMLDESPNVDLAFTDTRLFVDTLVQSLQNNQALLKVLFDGNQTQQINMIESCLLKRHFEKGDLQGREMEIIFAIGGAARLLVQEQSRERIEKVVQLIQKVIQ